MIAHLPVAWSYVLCLKVAVKGSVRKLSYFRLTILFFNSTSNKWYIPLSWFNLLNYAGIIVVDPLLHITDYDLYNQRNKYYIAI